MFTRLFITNKSKMTKINNRFSPMLLSNPQREKYKKFSELLI